MWQAEPLEHARDQDRREPSLPQGARDSRDRIRAVPGLTPRTPPRGSPRPSTDAGWVTSASPAWCCPCTRRCRPANHRGARRRHGRRRSCTSGSLRGGRASRSSAVAVNVMDYELPDNAGYRASGEPCVPGGPTAYFSTLPARRDAGRRSSMRASPRYTSNTAGTYLCNQTLYWTLPRRAGPRAPAGGRRSFHFRFSRRWSPARGWSSQHGFPAHASARSRRCWVWSRAPMPAAKAARPREAQYLYLTTTGRRTGPAARDRNLVHAP